MQGILSQHVVNRTHQVEMQRSVNQYRPEKLPEEDYERLLGVANRREGQVLS